MFWRGSKLEQTSRQTYPKNIIVVHFYFQKSVHFLINMLLKEIKERGGTAVNFVSGDKAIAAPSFSSRFSNLRATATERFDAPCPCKQTMHAGDAQKKQKKKHVPIYSFCRCMYCLKK